MRRVTAQLAFLAVWIGFLGPTVATAEEIGRHACCLRLGAHHCQGSGEAGFQSAMKGCPYFTSVAQPNNSGFVASQAEVNSPLSAGKVTQQSLTVSTSQLVQSRTARAPPTTLL